MTRRTALLALRRHLLARKKSLGQKRAGELASLQNARDTDAIGDSADLAFEADGDEISSRLVELDDWELDQIERALMRWQRRTFGVCESCENQIPLTRLNALPHTAFCIHCEREIENNSALLAGTRRGSWNQVSDPQAPMQDRRVDVAELEKQISGER